MSIWLGQWYLVARLGDIMTYVLFVRWASFGLGCKQNVMGSGASLLCSMCRATVSVLRIGPRGWSPISADSATYD